MTALQAVLALPGPLLDALAAGILLTAAVWAVRRWVG